MPGFTAETELEPGRWKEKRTALPQEIWAGLAPREEGLPGTGSKQ